MSLLHASSLIVGAIEGTQISADEAQFFRKHPLGGLTIFTRNFPESWLTVADMLRSFRELVNTSALEKLPPVIAIDQEGGRVRRFKEPFPNWGPAMRLGLDQDKVSSEIFLANSALCLGYALRGFGINVNFAPVLDIDTEPTNTAIGDRCFGQDPVTVIKRAGIFMRSMQQSGVQGCLKHFPGQGDAKVDTHLGQANIPLSMSALEQRELVPFKALLPECFMVMMSHVIYPEVDSRPASLSPVWMQDVLREKWNFRGVLVSDDFNMEAIDQDEDQWGEAVVQAVAAGTDICRAPAATA